jgi:hypothetical protein
VSASAPPGLDHYNARAAVLDLRSGGGAPLRFVAPDDAPESYEERVFARGEVVTRPDNWHDAYNAEVWLEFPQAKAALNRRHVEAFQTQRARGEQGRGRVRDRLTQFDECGVVVAGLASELWRALCAHGWRTVFVARRAEVVATTRFMIFGHASREALRKPYLGLCGKMLWLETDPGAPADVDAALARRLTSADLRERWPPLPLLGIPGLCAANADPDYYDDTRQFRPAPAHAA